ncbi:hypothetical protein [Bombella apis]|uniref:OmpA family protein n=1 Tax=Bombella apis TaxID=1785988 RepID=A0ABR9MRK7_9PROT|nr:hypothetical protein [Bombella apis]MBE1724006.1 hypothetical protein [Bombella apis]MBR9730346.1 hypothetical protein [Bombella apis]MUH01994.1 hypothetical protein [Bombella sp. ESL0387]
MTPSLFTRSFRSISTTLTRGAGLFRFGLCLLALPAFTAGCQHRDAIDTTRDIAHDIMGGEIRRLRPPTPGYDRPAPNIALIPTTRPEFPSADARAMITTRLERDRNYSQRISAAGGALPIGMMNPPPPQPQNGGSMTLESQSNGPAASHPAIIRQDRSTGPAGSGSSLIYQPVTHALPIHLPDPGQPPKPLLFPGFSLPSTVLPVIPDFDTATPVGALVRFQADTDHLDGDQTDTFNQIVAQRHRHLLLIRGFGTTLSAQSGLSPDEQTHEIGLALLRARAVAQRLASLGVPHDDMRLTGEAIGDGVRVSYEKNIRAGTAPAH